MKSSLACLVALAVLMGGAQSTTMADPSLECNIGNGTQVEIGRCVAETEAKVDQAIEIVLGFASRAAQELDGVTGRTVASPALERAQAAWSAYRDQHCEFVGSTFGGGSGTGIAIRSCRVELGRARVTELMKYAQ